MQMTRVELARHMTPDSKSGASSFPPHLLSWASWIRTNECRSQSPVPYRLAIAHYYFQIPVTILPEREHRHWAIQEEKKENVGDMLEN